MDASKITVLITTSGIGNRLGNLTKFTNKSLVRVGEKPSISYIIESYPFSLSITSVIESLKWTVYFPLTFDVISPCP